MVIHQLSERNIAVTITFNILENFEILTQEKYQHIGWKFDNYWKSYKYVTNVWNAIDDSHIRTFIYWK